MSLSSLHASLLGSYVHGTELETRSILQGRGTLPDMPADSVSMPHVCNRMTWATVTSSHAGYHVAGCQSKIRPPAAANDRSMAQGTVCKLIVLPDLTVQRADAGWWHGPGGCRGHPEDAEGSGNQRPPRAAQEGSVRGEAETDASCTQHAHSGIVTIQHPVLLLSLLSQK